MKPEDPYEGSRTKDEPLIVDSEIDSKELADLLNEGNDGSGNQPQDAKENVQDDMSQSSQSSNEDLPDQCGANEGDGGSIDAPSLVSEPKEHPQRTSSQPERYDLSTGGSYVQVKYCHHMRTQEHPKERTLKYAKGEEKVVASILMHLHEHCNAQLYNLRKVLKECKSRFTFRLNKISTNKRPDIISFLRSRRSGNYQNNVFLSVSPAS